MTENGQEKIIAFDTLFTTNQIQMLKILLAYLEPSQQKIMAVYIKFMELQYTMSFFNKHSCTLTPFPKENNINATRLCDEILPFCSPSEQETLINMKNMYQNFENMQEMMQMVQMMQDMFPEGETPFGSDISQLFEMFQK